MLGSFTLTVGGYEIFMAVCLAVSLGISALGLHNRCKMKRDGNLYGFDPTGYVISTLFALAVSGIGSVIHFDYKSNHDALPEAWKAPVERLHDLPKSQRAMGLTAMVEYEPDWPELTFENIEHIILCGDNDVCRAVSLDALKPYLKTEPDLGMRLVEGPPLTDDSIMTAELTEENADKIVALTESN